MLHASYNFNNSHNENKEQINPVSNKPLPTIAPTPLATNTVITSISPKDIAKKVAVSVGLGTKQNGRIIIDPTSTGVIIGKRNKTYYVLTREKDIYDNQRYGITTPDKQNYLAKISWKKADLDLAILEFESTLTYDITSIGNVDKLNTALNIYIYGWTMSNGIRTPVLSEGLLRDVSKNFIYESRSIITLGSGIILNTDGQLIGLHKGFSSDGKTGRAISIQKFLHSIPFNIGLASPLQKEIMQSPCISTLFGNCAK